MGRQESLTISKEKEKALQYDCFDGLINASVMQAFHQNRIINIAKLAHTRQIAQNRLELQGVAYIMPFIYVAGFNRFHIPVVHIKYLKKFSIWI